MTASKNIYHPTGKMQSTGSTLTYNIIQQKTTQPKVKTLRSGIITFLKNAVKSTSRPGFYIRLIEFDNGDSITYYSQTSDFKYKVGNFVHYKKYKSGIYEIGQF